MELNDNTNIIDFINSNRNVLDLIMDLVPIPLFVKDKAGKYIHCNLAFTNFLSFKRDEIIGKYVYDIWNKNEADTFYVQYNDLLTNGGLQVYETEITSSKGQKYTVQFHKQAFLNEKGEIAGFLGAFYDITERNRLSQALEKLAKIDELTGLSNRRDGISKLSALFEESKLNNSPFCVAMIDIDHFKKINDKYGHSTGDIVLKEFAGHLTEFLRNSDICFRYGGEEFIVLLPQTKISDGLVILERLRQGWSEKPIHIAQELSIFSTVSVGLVENNSHHTSYEALINKSDDMMYMAKEKGRNCCVYEAD